MKNQGQYTYIYSWSSVLGSHKLGGPHDESHEWSLLLCDKF